MTRLLKQVGGSACALAAVAGIVTLSIRTTHRRAPKPALITNPPSARPDVEAYIASRKNDPSSEVQDKVGNARLRLGYAIAHAHPGAETAADYEAARKAFLSAESEYKGKGRMGADFGGIPDAARYQAIACLCAEHRDSKAKKELEDFLRRYPLSPLCKAAYRRLVRLNGGKSTHADELLLASAVSAQQRHTRFELSVCGPKAIEAVLPILGRPSQGYKELAQSCGTKDTGTTLEGMRKGLKSVGVMSFGYELDAKDFRQLSMPAILLKDGHYVVILARSGKQETVYDPTTEITSSLPLPDETDSRFVADVITFSPLQLISS